VSGTYVAIANFDDTYLMAGGLSVTSTTVRNEADRPGLGEAILGLARRAGRAGCTLILRGTGRSDGFHSFLLASCRTGRRQDESTVASLVEEAAALLARWRTAPLDRAGLDAALTLGPSWEVARLGKPAPSLDLLGYKVPLLVGLNPDVRTWYPVVTRREFVLDLALFPLAGASSPGRQDTLGQIAALAAQMLPLAVANLPARLAEVTAQSRVLANHLRGRPAEARQAECLRGNEEAVALACNQQVFMGTALTLACPQAAALAPEVRAWRHPFGGDSPAEVRWTAQPEEGEEEAILFAALDYEQERAALSALEPDARRPAELADELALAWTTWHGARAALDPLDCLLIRVEMFEQHLGRRLEELRTALEVARKSTEAALAHLRRTSEGLVKQHFSRHFPGRSKEPPLEKMIEELRNAGKVPNPVYSLMHTVRVFGNIGAHDTGYKVRDLGVVVEALAAILEWHFGQGDGRPSVTPTAPPLA
jgi:hypothetical protein